MGAQTLVIGPAYTLTQWAALEFDPFTVQFLRVWGAALSFALLFTLTGKWATVRALPRSKWKSLAGVAVVGIVINQFCFTLGLRYTTPANSSLIYALTPMMVLLLAAGIFRTERLTPLKGVGVAVALAGVVMVFVSLGREFRLDHLLGNAITFVALVCWALYMVLGKEVFKGLPPVVSTGLVMMLGALWFTPIGIGHTAVADFATPTWKGWVGLATLIFINSFLSFTILNYALSGLQASQVAIYNNIQPITAAMFSVWVMQAEELTLMLGLGGVVTLAGVLLLNLARRRAEIKATAQAQKAIAPKAKVHV